MMEIVLKHGVRINSDCDGMDIVDSTMFSHVGYSRSEERLFLIFRNSPNKIYTLKNVPYSLWKDFMDHPSMGRFYNLYIKNHSEFDTKSYEYITINTPSDEEVKMKSIEDSIDILAEKIADKVWQKIVKQLRS